MSSPAVDIGDLADFANAVPTMIRVGRRELVVVKWKDELFALRNVCPHQSQRLHTGAVRHEFRSGPDGELEFVEPVLVCPWHNWPFALRSGRCTVDRTKRVRTFDVYVDQGRVMIRA